MRGTPRRARLEAAGTHPPDLDAKTSSHSRRLPYPTDSHAEKYPKASLVVEPRVEPAHEAPDGAGAAVVARRQLKLRHRFQPNPPVCRLCILSATPLPILYEFLTPTRLFSEWDHHHGVLACLSLVSQEKDRAVWNRKRRIAVP